MIIKEIHVYGKYELNFVDLNERRSDPIGWHYFVWHHLKFNKSKSGLQFNSIQFNLSTH